MPAILLGRIIMSVQSRRSIAVRRPESLVDASLGAEKPGLARIDAPTAESSRHASPDAQVRSSGRLPARMFQAVGRSRGERLRDTSATMFVADCSARGRRHCFCPARSPTRSCSTPGLFRVSGFAQLRLQQLERHGCILDGESARPDGLLALHRQTDLPLQRAILRQGSDVARQLSR